MSSYADDQELNRLSRNLRDAVSEFCKWKLRNGACDKENDCPYCFVADTYDWAEANL